MNSYMDMNYVPPKDAYVSTIKHDFYNLPIKIKKLAVNGKTGSSIMETDNLSNIDEFKNISNLSAFDIVANTSQRDYMSETTFDKYRCGSSSLLNAYFLLGGDFNLLADKFVLDKSLTYKSIHLAQDKIYSYANVDNKEGLESSYVYSYDKSGTIKKVVSRGEMSKAAQIMGLNVKPLIGSNVKTINNKKESIDNFLQNNKGVLVVSVYLNTSTGEISSISEKENNHYVTVFKANNQFYLADTGRKSTGQKNNLMSLENNQIDSLVYNNPSVINGITIGD